MQELEHQMSFFEKTCKKLKTGKRAANKKLRAKTIWLCVEEFEPTDVKVRDDCHLLRKYGGAIQQSEKIVGSKVKLFSEQLLSSVSLNSFHMCL